MKVSIYNETPELPKETKITLRLTERPDHIFVTIVDEKGEKVHCGNLMSFDKQTMLLSRCNCVSPTISLPLNKDRQLLMVGE